MNALTLGLLLALAGTGCATVPVVRIAEGPIPAKLQALNAKVLADARQFETIMEQRGAVYNDAALTQHLTDLGARLLQVSPVTGPGVIRFRIARDTSLNAYALAHGTIFLTTGMVAQLHNEHQLALVMAHELAHVLNRDMLAFTQALHHKTISAKLTDLFLTPPLALFGAGIFSEAGIGLIYQASVAGYAQDQERHADADGLSTLQRAGLNPAQAVHAFVRLVDDETTYRRPRHWAVASDHPASAERLADLKRQLGWSETTALEPSVMDAAYAALTDPLRYENVVLHQRLREYMHAVAVAEDLLRRHPGDARALCALGDTYRLMADDPDAVKEELSQTAWQRHAGQQSRADLVAHWRSNARRSYEQALPSDAPEAYRGLGLLALAEDARADATRYLEGYLARAPQAPDRRFVQHHLTRLQQQQEPIP